MRGSIRERSPGHWAIILDQRDPATGKRKRKWHSYQGTKRQAQIECARLISEMKGGAYVEPSKLTLAQFFERWLKHIKPNVSPRTHERYERSADEKHRAAARREDAFETPADRNQRGIRESFWKAADATAKAACRRAPCITSTGCFIEALGSGRALETDRPQPGRAARKAGSAQDRTKAVVTIDAPTTATVFDAARERRLFIPLVLASLCGLRRGEITALRWRAVDLDSGQLAVVASTEQTDAGEIREKETKSGKTQNRRPALYGRRRIATLAADAGSGTSAARRQGRRQLARRNESRRRAAAAAEPHARGVGVLEGMGRHPAQAAAQPRQPYARREGPSQRSFRSGWAIPRSRSRWTSTSHLMPNMQGEAAAAVDDVLRAAINKRAERRWVAKR